MNSSGKIISFTTAKKLMSEWFKTRQEEKRNADVETTEELSEPIERTLEEVLQRRQGYSSGNADSGEEEEAEAKE